MGGLSLNILERKPGGSSQIVFIKTLLICWYLVMQGLQGLAEHQLVGFWYSLLLQGCLDLAEHGGQVCGPRIIRKNH